MTNPSIRGKKNVTTPWKSTDMEDVEIKDIISSKETNKIKGGIFLIRKEVNDGISNVKDINYLLRKLERDINDLSWKLERDMNDLYHGSWEGT